MSEEERREEQRSLLRHALEQVVDELGERLRADAIELPPSAISAVSEALTAAYVRGLDHGLRQAARDLEERMTELGVAVQTIIADPPPGEEGAPPASGA